MSKQNYHQAAEVSCPQQEEEWLKNSSL